MANFTLGKDCKAYFNATPVTAIPTAAMTATEIPNIKNLNLELSKDTADISTRGSGGWAAEVGTLIRAKITFQMVWKPADGAFSAFKTAFLADTEVAFQALDGAGGTTGSQGPAGNFTVTKFSRDESLTEAVMADVELSPSSFNGWVTAT